VKHQVRVRTPLLLANQVIAEAFVVLSVRWETVG